MWFMEEPIQFSVDQTAQSLACSIMEKPKIGLDDCLRILLSCFRKRMSGLNPATGFILPVNTLGSTIGLSKDYGIHGEKMMTAALVG